MIIRPSSNKIVSFKGLKQNLEIANEVALVFKKEFPVLKSSTFEATKLYQGRAKKGKDLYSKTFKKNDENYRNAIYKLRKKVKPIISKLIELDEDSHKYTKMYLGKYIKRLKKFMKKYQAANCEEQSHIVQYELLKRGIEAHVIKIDFLGNNKRLCNDHQIILIGMNKELPDKNLRFYEPETWGKDVVLLDVWGNVINNVDDGLKAIKDFFLFDSTKEKICFELVDRVNVKKSIDILKHKNSNENKILSRIKSILNK